MALPIKPSTFLQGVGLNGTCEITDASFTVFDFNGKAPAQPALTVTAKTEGGKEQVQYYPAGSLVAVAPSADGETPSVDDAGNYGSGPYLCAVKENITALFGDSDFAFFMTHLVNAGFPEKSLESGDARALIGLVAEFGPAPKKYTDQSGSEKARSVSVPLKVVRLPGEKGKGAGAAKSKAAAPASKGAAAGAGGAIDPAEIDAIAQEALLSALAKKSPLQLKTINPQLIVALKDQPSAKRTPAVARAKEPEFLNALMEAGSVVYDEAAGTVELAA